LEGDIRVEDPSHTCKVITSDGNEFGPVTVVTLRQWYLEGRIAASDRVLYLPDGSMSSVKDFVSPDTLEFSEHLGSFLHGRVTVVVGNITRQRVDAVVNAANPSLLGGGGVDGAIHEAGGPRILEECREIRRTRYPDGLPRGEAVITSGGDLPAGYVIHTVGPVRGQNGGRDAELLARSYRNSLALAVELGLSSIALPAISTGIYGYPLEEAAAVSSEAIREVLASDETLSEVRLVFYSREDAQAFLANHRLS
jgi:O-acetyl-ADP-ribose deacetylase (regulator of RNase III)